MLYLPALSVLFCLGNGPRDESIALLAPPSLEGTWELVYMEADSGSPMGGGAGLRPSRPIR